MIEKMHDKTNSLAFKIIFGLIVVSLVLGGIGGGFLNFDHSAAKVNGEEISQQAFNQAKQQQQNVLSSQLGERFGDLMDNPDYAKQFNQAILNELVDTELLRQYAKTLRLDISTDQVKSEIVNSDIFQRDGKFDNALYLQLLRNNNINADQYAASVYENMLFAQLQENLIHSDFSVPAQQELLAKLLLQKRTARFATYLLKDEINNQSASEDELQRYYTAHKAEFINPELLTVEYVILTPKDLEKRIQITKEQIETYYQTNKAQYMKASEAKIAHIQVADEVTATDLAQQLKNGADFTELAKAHSTDSFSANQGGELGWVKTGTYPPAFEAAFSTLKEGQISEPTKVDNGYHLIKVLARSPETVIPVEQVQSQIADIIRAELVAMEYSTTAREMANKAFENSGSLDAVAQVAELNVQTTEAFTRDTIPAELNHDKVLKVLFGGDLRQAGQNSEVIDLSTNTGAATLFVRVKDYKAQSIQSFEEAKTSVALAVKREKAEQALMAKAEEEINALQSGNGRVTFEPERTFVLLNTQHSSEVTERLFAMPMPHNGVQYQVAKNQNGDVVIIALDKVEEGNIADFQAMSSQFTLADRALLRKHLLADLRARAKIEFNQDFLEQVDSLDR